MTRALGRCSFCSAAGTEPVAALGDHAGAQSRCQSVGLRGERIEALNRLFSASQQSLQRVRVSARSQRSLEGQRLFVKFVHVLN